MAKKKKKYLDSLFNVLSEEVGWDTLSEKELLMNFIVRMELVDEFMNYAEDIASVERGE
jgi:hypothetical protein